MAIMAVGFVFSLFIWFAQKKEQARLFPPTLCAGCKEPIHFNGREYVHTATGQSQAELVWISYVDENGKRIPEGDGGQQYRDTYGIQYHWAVTASTPEEQELYQR